MPSTNVEPLQAFNTIRRLQPKHEIHEFRPISPLTEDNWIMHKFVQTIMLEERGLYAVVNGEEGAPDKSLHPGDYQLWMDKDISARGQIIRNLSKEVQPIVYGCKTAAEMWKALRDEYESSDPYKVILVRERYNSLLYADGTKMRDHIHKLLILREQLNLMGEKISDEYHIRRLLNSLPPSWDITRLAIMCNTQPQPTIANVKGRLLNEEAAREADLFQRS